ncbi:MAG: amino acid adenylation domain-containing protein, partial [Minicystis sp.]
PPTPTAALKALCRQGGLTLFMALLAAFQALLGRYSGQDDIVVGSPIAGRTRAETEELIGFFLNTLVLRTRLGGEPSFRELCARVREVTLGAYAHQDLPFERLVEELSPPRDLGQTPLFQVYFNMLNLAPRWEDLKGLRAELWPNTQDIAKFDLNLYAEERDGGIDLHLVYNIDVFDAPQTGALLAHLTELLYAVVADPDLPITRIPLSLPAAAEAPTSTTKGRPGPRFEVFPAEATEQSIGQRFEEQVRRRGGSVAIRTGAGEVSYAELGAFADRVASALGAMPGRVALLFEPGPSMIAAILGALEAGATYVPLDLASPPERLAAMLEDAGATTLLTHPPSLSRARALAPPGCVVLDVDALTLTLAPPLRVAVSPDAPAYILYTSGSTGRPKGVVQSHRNMLCHVRNYINRLHLDEDDAIGLLASYAFDAAIMDIFGALLSGATLCPIDLRNTGLLHLPALLRELRVSVYHSTPTVFRHLAGMLGESEVLEGIRLVVLGGEEAQARDVEAFRACFPPESLLVNGLGPTESTLALQYFVDRETPLPRKSVPVGYPVEGVAIRLLTPLGEQVALWGIGQIEISSPQVALGYWNRPDLTAAAFSTDAGGLRGYRTGDLARRLPGGALEYLGRADHQVKVRGHRIEPGEIEARLLTCPGVAKAVVAVREDLPGGPSLAAYVVPLPGRAPRVEELRAHVKKGLPAYMVPAAFMLLDALPLLPNGKIDRRALPAPEAPDAGPGEALAPPRDDLEVGLASCFCEVLGLRTVGVNDSFFDLGGQSMLAVKLVEGIERRFHRTVKLAALFEAQTVEQLAALLRAEKPARSHFALVPIQKTGSKRPLFLVSRPNVNALGYVALARHLGPDRPVYALQFDYPEEEELARPYT